MCNTIMQFGGIQYWRAMNHKTVEREACKGHSASETSSDLLKVVHNGFCLNSVTGNDNLANVTALGINSNNSSQ
jgi:hypothetical protein